MALQFRAPRPDLLLVSVGGLAFAYNELKGDESWEFEDYLVVLGGAWLVTGAIAR